MKTILVAMISSFIVFGCGEKTENRNDNNTDEAVQNESAVEQNSGENISPQLEDSVDRFTVDSVSSAAGANEAKKDELEDGK